MAIRLADLLIVVLAAIYSANTCPRYDATSWWKTQKHRGYPHDENPWSIENNMNLVRSSLITLQTHMKAERIVSALVLRHYSEWWLGVASDECRDHCTYADPVNCTVSGKKNKTYVY
ncbi:unnamed protein product [Rotaria socialis]|uniref:Uncharacterized protein n=1 Tax=Rotaria socialis TaxID=392032 RepID=A0A818QQ14_9BILA|nr:unnamed protein product [Rotaria socialis]CAF4591256.1 unnamed protein product [Rotaria socialis]